jgi:LPXTG-site transpeptidase (sortase) family protein
MAVPDNIEEVAWYRFGATPGSRGSAVLAAHVDLAGAGPGVFFDLDALQEGNMVKVHYVDDTTLSFIVESVERIPKTDLDVSALFSSGGEPTLRLVTCGGGFNPQLGRYDDNVVVTLTPTPEEAP